MIRMFVRHPVEDFTSWKKAYDDFESERPALGVVGDAVYQSVDDPNDVTAYHDFTTLEEAQAFGSSDKLKEVMTAAGVSGLPTIWFVSEVF